MTAIRCRTSVSGFGVKEGYISLSRSACRIRLQQLFARSRWRLLIILGASSSRQINQEIYDLDPDVPYMYLPRSWCEAIASNEPGIKIVGGVSTYERA